MPTDPSAEARSAVLDVLARLAEYECWPRDCGDRFVLKLTADEAANLLEGVLDEALTRARAEGRREGLEEAARVCSRAYVWHRASNVGRTFTEQDCVDEFTADGAEECADAIRALAKEPDRG